MVVEMEKSLPFFLPLPQHYFPPKVDTFLPIMKQVLWLYHSAAHEVLLINMFHICRDDIECLAAKLKRITVADLIDKMEVSVVPFAIEKHEICSIYKLKVKLYDPELYPRHTDITLEDCQNALLNEFVKEMEAAIKAHLLLLSKISGINSESQSKGSDDMDKDGVESGSQTDEEDSSDDDDDNEERGACVGSKVRKRKRKAKDGMYYEDDPEVEAEEEKLISEHEYDEEVVENENEDEDKEESMEEDVTETHSGPPDSQERKEKPKVKERKKSDKNKAIYVACDGLCFEVHFKITNQPHILLSQVCWDCIVSVNFQYFVLAIGGAL